ncbi:MAG: N-6 DNA methylase [Ilumatobacteraceae bacterium]
MVETGAQRADRKRFGAWYTPPDLVDTMVDAVVTAEFVASRRTIDRPVTVLDPACGDGRFLVAVTARVEALGGSAAVTGVDIDATAADVARLALPAASIVVADALDHDWTTASFDVVIGNPPFLSQMAEATTRGGAGGRGAGAYADVAVEFLALAAELVSEDGGRLALVLPQSVLASRDAAAVRASVDGRSRMFWSSWSPERVFDAQVHTCALAFEFGPDSPTRAAGGTWSHVVTDRQGVPGVPDDLETSGELGDRATLNANFRDEYYGMIPAVTDAATDRTDGPPLITSGLIDPGRSLWGVRPITFAKRSFAEPRVDIGALDARMREWARRRLVPKVLVANQTRVIEAVCDPTGAWLPGVPVVAVYPRGAHWDDAARADPRTAATDTELARQAWEIAAVLTSPIASAWSWHRGGGTGLSADAIRTSPTVLAALPWPAGDLAVAVDAVRRGDVRGCGAAVDAAYGIVDDTALDAWWVRSLERIEARNPIATPDSPIAPPAAPAG